ncbi:MAG: D-alanyl-D-alanine carboxypeptidase family protein [Ruminococcaceae bacterium]|nr:D-alanyl-D-alanine carboxypeptidase family protein [Oscillospiraceae bacterium]
MASKNKRQQAILKRNIFLGSVSLVLIAAIVLIAWVVGSGLGDNDNKDNKDNKDTTSQSSSTPSQTESTDNTSSDVESKKPLPSTPEPVQVGTFEGDANFTKTILVNIKNPLPKDHDYKANMMVFPSEYKWYSQAEVYRKIDKDIWPYLKAMMDAARADGVDIGIISAWRDYGTQVTLYEAQIKKWKDKGYSEADAIKEASSRVAVPGTSEHHTGLAVDFNSTQTSFENTKAFKWLKENAQDYGFIMRYEKEKMDITGGIIYEPWHWRFVGINIAKEMKELGYCYEEYCQYKGIGDYIY